jgi:8-oxo-dGTP diphosphatase
VRNARQKCRRATNLPRVRERKRAAAVIVRDGRVLMVHERSHRSGREWWTLPGGGIEPGETSEQAVRREVLEETGLVVEEATYLLDTPYPSGMTSVFAVTVGEGEPVLGVAVDGPEAVGLDWIALPDVAVPPGTVPVPPMIVAVPTTVRQRSTTK